MDKLEGEQLDRLRASFDENHWGSIPAMPGALAACHDLNAAGFELVCVTALPAHFAQARQNKLQRLGFPIEVVIATDNAHTGRSPKADALHRLRPTAFVDDYLPYLVGVHSDIHLAISFNALTDLCRFELHVGQTDRSFNGKHILSVTTS